MMKFYHLTSPKRLFFLQAFEKLEKKEKKAIYSHELGHLRHLDAFRYIIADTVLSLLPEKLKNSLSREFVVISELYADRYALKKVSKESLLKAVLKIKEFNLFLPLGYNFSQERFLSAVNETNPSLPKTAVIPLIIIQLIAVLLYLYKTCFCGVMG
ncbi:MAG: hypothetical protein Q9M89_00410 [Persephonella sp.]|nr:hypothetical protein [Persephonella sp.]